MGLPPQLPHPDNFYRQGQSCSSVVPAMITLTPLTITAATQVLMMVVLVFVCAYMCAHGCASMSYEGVSVETRTQYQVSFSITLLLLSLDSLSPSLQGEVRVSGEESVSWIRGSHRRAGIFLSLWTQAMEFLPPHSLQKGSHHPKDQPWCSRHSLTIDCNFSGCGISDITCRIRSSADISSSMI